MTPVLSNRRSAASATPGHGAGNHTAARLPHVHLTITRAGRRKLGTNFAAAG